MLVVYKARIAVHFIRKAGGITLFMEGEHHGPAGRGRSEKWRHPMRGTWGTRRFGPARETEISFLTASFRAIPGGWRNRSGTRREKRGGHMVRVCIYNYDMGIFRRAWIQSVTLDELAKIQKFEFKRVLMLDESDWYGQNAPSVFPE